MAINLSHGSGGKETARLIEEVFLKAFGNEIGSGTRDAAVLNVSGRLAFTTDSFVVEPLFFAGGDIGTLAVCGTVNDLLTTGAVPKYLSASFILEEGLEIDTLRRVAASMARVAKEAGVLIVTGDTKVIKGSGGMYINTAGIGEIVGETVDFSLAREGDALIVTGTLGDHHACIMSARMGIENGIKSDVAPLNDIVSQLKKHDIELCGMRDITRGGLATVLSEIAKQYGLGAQIREADIPVSRQVKGLCEILGLDPLYMGNEGNMLIAVRSDQAGKALDIVRQTRYGKGAAIIGFFGGEGVNMVTRIGGMRMVGPLVGESLPRIC